MCLSKGVQNGVFFNKPTSEFTVEDLLSLKDVNIARQTKNGTTYAHIYGQSFWDISGSRKSFQLHIGEEIGPNLFRSKKWLVRYDPANKCLIEADPIEQFFPEKTYLHGCNCIVDLGAIAFLNSLLEGVGFYTVLDKIECKCKDSFIAFLFYRILDGGPNDQAEIWAEQSGIKLWFPKANLKSQRISELLTEIGSVQNKHSMLSGIIKFIKSSSFSKCKDGIGDSSLIVYKGNLDITQVSTHNDETNVGFRIFAIIEKLYGLPIYYDIVPGNIADSDNIGRAVTLLKEYGCDLEYLLLDAAFSAPAVRNRLYLYDIGYTTRFHENYDNMLELMRSKLPELDKKENKHRINNRIVNIIKVRCIIGTNNETGEPIEGFCFICRDSARSKSSSLRLESNTDSQKLPMDEICEKEDMFGVFAILTTKDFTIQEILIEYFTRQGIEQFFDYIKNFLNLKTVYSHNENTLRGVVLTTYIASFITVLIKNRLKILDYDFLEVLSDTDSKTSDTISQRANKKMSIMSLSMTYRYLNGLKGELFNDKCIMTVPTPKVKEIFKAFGLNIPLYIAITENGLEYHYDKTDNNNDNIDIKKIIFALPKHLIDDESVKSNKTINKSKSSTNTKDKIKSSKEGEQEDIVDLRNNKKNKSKQSKKESTKDDVKSVSNIQQNDSIKTSQIDPNVIVRYNTNPTKTNGTSSIDKSIGNSENCEHNILKSKNEGEKNSVSVETDTYNLNQNVNTSINLSGYNNLDNIYSNTIESNATDSYLDNSFSTNNNFTFYKNTEEAYNGYQNSYNKYIYNAVESQNIDDYCNDYYSNDLKSNNNKANYQYGNNGYNKNSVTDNLSQRAIQDNNI